VQVTNPATSGKGWIYAGNIAGTKARRGSKRLVNRPKSHSQNQIHFGQVWAGGLRANNPTGLGMRLKGWPVG
jgi:hypothetical protein